MEQDYTAKVLKRLLILCWMTLAICFVIKIFGGNFFNIVCNDKRFIAVCDFIQNTFLYYVVGFISYYAGQMLLWLAMARQLKFTKKDCLIALTIITVCYVIQALSQLFINPVIVGFAMTILRLLVVPLLIFRFNWKTVLIITLADFGTQLLSNIIKGIALTQIIADNVLVTLIYLIDYYIMLVIVYLYSYKTNKNKEVFMGLFGTWWLHKPLAELEALLPTLKDEKQRESCKARIEKLKKKEEKKKSN